MSNVCIAERRADSQVMTSPKVSSDVVVILAFGSHRLYLFPYSVDDRLLQYALNSSFFCGVCECESNFQSLLKRRQHLYGQKAMHSGNPVTNTQQKDGDGKKGRIA